MGIVNIIIDLGLKIDLRKLIVHTYTALTFLQPDRSEADTMTDLMDFILQRMRGVMLERGFSYDIIDAVLSQDGGDLQQIIARAEAVQEFKSSPDWEDFLEVFTRSHNLSKK